MMQSVRVRLFARFRDAFGADVIEVGLPANANVKDLRDALTARNPSLAALLDCSQVAVNNEFARQEALLTPADEIALIPPVSGG